MMYAMTCHGGVMERLTALMDLMNSTVAVHPTMSNVGSAIMESMNALVCLVFVMETSPAQMEWTKPTVPAQMKMNSSSFDHKILSYYRV